MKSVLMIIATYELTLNNVDVVKFADAIDFLNMPNKKFDGRLKSVIFYNDKMVDSLIYLYEEWESIIPYTIYLKSDHFKQVLSLFELSTVKPEIKIFESKSVKNFDWVQSVIVEDSMKQADYEEQPGM